MLYDASGISKDVAHNKSILVAEIGENSEGIPTLVIYLGSYRSQLSYLYPENSM